MSIQVIIYFIFKILFFMMIKNEKFHNDFFQNLSLNSLLKKNKFKLDLLQL